MAGILEEKKSILAINFKKKFRKIVFNYEIWKKSQEILILILS